MCSVVTSMCAHICHTTHLHAHVHAYIYTCTCTHPHTDMEKFPVRMKDNDLLVTQLFEDPFKEPITALSVYITPHICT